MSSLALYSAAGALLGYLEGAVTWEPPLDGVPSLTAAVPKEWNGVDQLALAESADIVGFEGTRYLIQQIDTDEDSFVTLAGESLAVELTHFPASMSTVPAVYQGTPSQIFADALAGYTRVPYGSNHEFEQNDGANPEGWVLVNGTPDVVRVTPGYGWSLRIPTGTGYMKPTAYTPVPPGVRFKVQFDYRNQDANRTLLEVHGINAAGQLGPRLASATYLPNTSSIWTTYTTGWITSRNDQVWVRFGQIAGGTGPSYFDNVYLLIETDSPGWSCASSAFDTRSLAEREIRVGSALIDPGTGFTEGVSYYEATGTSELFIRCTGPELTVYWTGSGAGTHTLGIDVDGVTFTTRAAGSDGSYVIGWPDRLREHQVRLYRVAGTVRVGLAGKVADLDDARTCRVEVGGDLLDLVKAVQAQAGGEYTFDTTARTFAHLTTGQNLRTAGVMFDLTPYLVDGSLRRAVQRRERADTVLFVGAPGIIALARATSPLATPRWKRIDDGSVTTRQGAQVVAQAWADALAGASVAYECTVTVEGALLISPGDTVRLPLLSPVEVRVLQISRSTEDAQAKLTLAARRLDGLEGFLRSLGLAL
jgi:hypothetical protein